MKPEYCRAQVARPSIDDDDDDIVQLFIQLSTKLSSRLQLLLTLISFEYCNCSRLDVIVLDGKIYLLSIDGASKVLQRDMISFIIRQINASNARRAHPRYRVETAAGLLGQPMDKLCLP